VSYLPILYSPQCPLPGEQVSLCFKGQQAIDIATKCYISVMPFALSYVAFSSLDTNSIVCPVVKILKIEEQEKDQSLRVTVVALEYVRISTKQKKHSKYQYPVAKVINTVSLGELGVKKIQPELANWIKQSGGLELPATEVIDISPILEHLELSANDRWQLINEDDPQRFEKRVRWHLVLSTKVQSQIKSLGQRFIQN